MGLVVGSETVLITVVMEQDIVANHPLDTVLLGTLVVSRFLLKDV